MTEKDPQPGNGRDDLVKRDAEAERLRRAMANFVTGVTVVTVAPGGMPYGMTCNSFTSISLDPPLVMVSASRQGRFHEVLLRSTRWAVSVLAAGQDAVARHFADPDRDRRQQFAAVPHRLSTRTGSPIIEGALAWLECETVRTVAAGDHTIVLGAVLAAEVAVEPTGPLSYFRGTFLDVANP